MQGPHISLPKGTDVCILPCYCDGIGGDRYMERMRTKQVLARSGNMSQFHILSMQIALTLLLCCAVIDGMDIVKKVEAIGSGDGKPSKTVHIADSGEITGAASAAA